MSTEAPPSYDAIMANLDKFLGSHPKAQEILTAIEQLPLYEKEVISEHPIEIIPLSAEQEKAFTKGAAIAISSPDGHQNLNDESIIINDAVKKIGNIFLVLTQQLSGLDKQFRNGDKGAFAPRLNRISQVSRATFMF